MGHNDSEDVIALLQQQQQHSFETLQHVYAHVQKLEQELAASKEENQHLHALLNRGVMQHLMDRLRIFWSKTALSETVDDLEKGRHQT